MIQKRNEKFSSSNWCLPPFAATTMVKDQSGFENMITSYLILSLESAHFLFEKPNVRDNVCIMPCEDV